MGSQLQDEISPVARQISALGDYEVDRLQVYGQQCLQPSNTNSANGIYTGFLLFLIAGGMVYVVLLTSPLRLIDRFFYYNFFYSPSWCLIRVRYTCSHPEHRSQATSCLWYCISRCGRVGKRQDSEEKEKTSVIKRDKKRPRARSFFGLVLLYRYLSESPIEFEGFFYTVVSYIHPHNDAAFRIGSGEYCIIAVTIEYDFRRGDKSGIAQILIFPIYAIDIVGGFSEKRGLQDLSRSGNGISGIIVYADGSSGEVYAGACRIHDPGSAFDSASARRAHEGGVYHGTYLFYETGLFFDIGFLVEIESCSNSYEYSDECDDYGEFYERETFFCHSKGFLR